MCERSAPPPGAGAKPPCTTSVEPTTVAAWRDRALGYAVRARSDVFRASASAASRVSLFESRSRSSSPRFFFFSLLFSRDVFFPSSSASAISSATTNSGSSLKPSGSRLAASYGSEARTWSPGGRRVHESEPRSSAYRSANGSPSAAAPPCRKTRPKPERETGVTATAASLRGPGTSPIASGHDHTNVDVSRRHRSLRKPLPR